MREKDSRVRGNNNYSVSLVQCDLPERQKGNECGGCRKSASVSEKSKEMKRERDRERLQEKETEREKERKKQRRERLRCFSR